MNTYQVTLTPMSPMDDLPASDTLFGAICWGIRAIHGEGRLSRILEEFDAGDKPPFVISSSAPVLENLGDRVYFYPMLCLPGPDMGYLKGMAGRCSSEGLAFKRALTGVVEDWKRFRGVRFVSHEVMKSLLKEGSLHSSFEAYHSGREQAGDDLWSPLQLGGPVKIVSRDYLISEDEYTRVLQGQKPPKFQARTITQKNRIGRLTNSTSGTGELYYSMDLRFRSDPDGPRLMLYFLLKTSDVDFFRPVFRWLVDTGVGGNRTAGKNQFLLSDPEKADVPEVSGNVFFTLSRCLPGAHEEPLMYLLLSRRHRLESSHFRGADVWKKRVIYLREGSCFKYDERREHYGRIEEVKEVGNIRIRQNGIAFPIFGNANENNGSGS